MSISALRNQNSLDKLLQQVQKDDKPNTEKKSYVDERLWKPVVDKSGNGYAVIRFLPAPTGEELPWVRLWNHAFQGPTLLPSLQCCLVYHQPECLVNHLSYLQLYSK